MNVPSRYNTTARDAYVQTVAARVATVLDGDWTVTAPYPHIAELTRADGVAIKLLWGRGQQFRDTAIFAHHALPKEVYDELAATGLHQAQLDTTTSFTPSDDAAIDRFAARVGQRLVPIVAELLAAGVAERDRHRAGEASRDEIVGDITSKWRWATADEPARNGDVTVTIRDAANVTGSIEVSRMGTVARVDLRVPGWAAEDIAQVVAGIIKTDQ